MDTLPDVLAAPLVGAGLVSGAIVALVARAPREGLRSLLDFLLAAGLIRLTGDLTWTTLLLAAATIAVRQVVGRGLRRAGTTRTTADAQARHRDAR